MKVRCNWWKRFRSRTNIAVSIFFPARGRFEPENRGGGNPATEPADAGFRLWRDVCARPSRQRGRREAWQLQYHRRQHCLEVARFGGELFPRLVPEFHIHDFWARVRVRALGALRRGADLSWHAEVDIPLPERFFAGGGTSHSRLFAQPSRTSRSGDRISNWGLALLAFNQEMRFPMRLPFVGNRLGGTVFYDAGTYTPI